MADIQRTKTTLLTTLFQDGQSGGISAQDLRDLIVSVAPSFAGLEWTSEVASVIDAAGTFVKAAGATALTNNSATMSDGAVNNRLVYNGTTMVHFHIVLQASVSLVSGTNQDIAVALYKWDNSAGTGAILNHSVARTTIGGSDVEQLTSHADTMLDTGDYIELHVTNNTNTNNVTVENGYLFGVSMVM